jgi:hypothetical protein
VTCIVCQKAEPHDGWTVCNGCLGRLDDDLARIVELTRLAADRLIRETKGSSNGSRSVPGSRPPLDLAALDAAMGLDVLPLLDSWERMIRECYGLSPLGPATRARSGALAAERARSGVPGPPVTVLGSCGFLRAWLLRMAETPDFPLEELAREIREAVHSLERYDPTREGRRDGVPVHCTSDHPDADGRTCGYQLWTNGADIVTCGRCLTRWTPDDLLDAHDMDLLPAAVLILLDPDHPNPRKRIANWAARDRLTQHDSAPNPAGGPAVPLYRLGEYRSLIGTRIKEDTA